MSARVAFSSLSRGNRLRLAGRIYTVKIVDRSAGVVELERSGSKGRLFTLMEHAREPGKFVLSSARTNVVLDELIQA